MGSMEHKLSAYAENVLFHVVNPLVSLPNLMGELSTYGAVSNFQINYAKSEILPITVFSALASCLKVFFPFTWVSPSMRYLGIQFSDRLDSLYTHNYAPLLRKICSPGTEPHSRVGCTNILKLTILPRILFLLQMVPGQFKFVWGGKKPRLAMTLLQRSKLTGGLGIPNVFQYYQVIALQRVLNWRSHPTLKLWVPLEKTIAGRDLAYVPWVPSG